MATLNYVTWSPEKSSFALGDTYYNTTTGLTYVCTSTSNLTWTPIAAATYTVEAEYAKTIYQPSGFTKTFDTCYIEDLDPEAECNIDD